MRRKGKKAWRGIIGRRGEKVEKVYEGKEKMKKKMK